MLGVILSVLHILAAIFVVFLTLRLRKFNIELQSQV